MLGATTLPVYRFESSNSQLFKSSTVSKRTFIGFSDSEAKAWLPVHKNKSGKVSRIREGKRLVGDRIFKGMFLAFEKGVTAWHAVRALLIGNSIVPI